MNQNMQILLVIIAVIVIAVWYLRKQVKSIPIIGRFLP